MDFTEATVARHFGSRRKDYVQSKCVCEIPTPIQTNEYGNGEPATYACVHCGEALNGDTNDDPFRRWPGDLVSGEVAEARFREREPALLKIYANQLPVYEQRKLRGLTGEKWKAAVRAAVIRVVEAQQQKKQAPTPDEKPNRRHMRLIQEII